MSSVKFEVFGVFNNLKCFYQLTSIPLCVHTQCMYSLSSDFFVHVFLKQLTENSLPERSDIKSYIHKFHTCE